MEENSNITRFCFISNYINQIIEPINSRCVKIRFKPINKNDLICKLKSISLSENITITNDALECIANISNGDLRKSILLLQNVKYAEKNYADCNYKIKSDDIYEMCKYISDAQIKKYIHSIRQNDNILNIMNVSKDIINKGYVFNSVINKITQCIIYDKSVNDKSKAQVLFELSSIEKNINDGADEYIQLLKLMNIISSL